MTVEKQIEAAKALAYQDKIIRRSGIAALGVRVPAYRCSEPLHLYTRRTKK